MSHLSIIILHIREMVNLASDGSGVPGCCRPPQQRNLSNVAKSENSHCLPCPAWNFILCPMFKPQPREWQMILKLGLRHVLCALAIVMVALNLLAMTSAAAAPHACDAVHSEAAANHDHHAGTQLGCCDSMHCCPILPHLPSSGLPSETLLRPEAYLKSEQPLLLVKSIDPPPRSLGS